LNGQADARRLQQVLGPYRASGNGSCQVLVEYENDKAVCSLALGESWRVRPDTQLISELGAWLAPENVEVVYSSA
jgi:DNA polymerase III subunit alpha